MVSRTEGVPADFGVSDLRTTAALTLMPQFTDNSPLISTRQYERVWNFLYDENIVRSSLTWPETSTRKNFDAFSLVVRASLYGGS